MTRHYFLPRFQPPIRQIGNILQAKYRQAKRIQINSRGNMQFDEPLAMLDASTATRHRRQQQQRRKNRALTDLVFLTMQLQIPMVRKFYTTSAWLSPDRFSPVLPCHLRNMQVCCLWPRPAGVHMQIASQAALEYNTAHPKTHPISCTMYSITHSSHQSAYSIHRFPYRKALTS
ncbi:hypothetical protein GPALN_003239 [Globodera pallida]|nr:hypothetical protein GPALN_003239 [Globodera pallida]